MAALQNEKRIGWTNVGELENCVHFKIGKTFLLIHLLFTYLQHISV